LKRFFVNLRYETVCTRFSVEAIFFYRPIAFPLLMGHTVNIRKGGDCMEEAYCVKCKAKREMVETTRVTMANGRPAMKGKCKTCGTGMYKILKK